MKHRFFLTLIIAIGTPLLTNSQNLKESVSVVYRTGFNTNVSIGIFSSINDRFISATGFKPVSYVGLAKTLELNKRSDIEIELLYGGGGKRQKSSYVEDGRTKHTVIDISQHSILLPINYNYHFQKFSVGVAPVVRGVFGGHTYDSRFNVIRDLEYGEFSDYFYLGGQIKASFNIVESEKSNLILEPYLYTDISDMDNTSIVNIGLAIKFQLK